MGVGQLTAATATTGGQGDDEAASGTQPELRREAAGEGGALGPGRSLEGRGGASGGGGVMAEAALDAVRRWDTRIPGCGKG